jgi:hypothetical protein
MHRTVLAAVALTVLVPLGLRATAQDEKGLTVKGQIKIGDHAVKMEAGKLYEIRVEGNGFSPVLNLSQGFFRIAAAKFDKDAVTRYFIPAKTMEYRLYITPSVFGQLPQGPLEYTLKVNRIPIGKKPVLKQESELTDKDPSYLYFP